MELANTRNYGNGKSRSASGEAGGAVLGDGGGGGPGIRVHWPICSATTPAPGSDALSKYILIVRCTQRTLRHTPIFLCDVVWGVDKSLLT